MAKYLIALDDGHGMETAGKRTPAIPELGGRVIRENEFNRAVVKYLDAELKRCGFDTLIIAPGDSDVPLRDRTNLANSKNADAYISIHYNAFDGKFNDYDPEGQSLHIYPGVKDARKLAECILKYLRQGTPQKIRGILENNFHVLRETKMPAVLTENGFMDNKREALLMINVDFQKEVAREHAQGICDYFGVKYIPEPVIKDNGTVYRVQTGAFQNLAYAVNWEEDVAGKGEDTYLIQDSDDKLYKVQVGAYKNKLGVDNKEKELKKKGLPTFITTKSGRAVTKEEKAQTSKANSKPVAKPTPTPAPKPAQVNKPTLKLGSRGKDVTELQNLLNKLNFNVGKADSIFGDKTLKGVKAYQSSRKLVADGIVGAKTWNSLLNDNTPKTKQGQVTASALNVRQSNNASARIVTVVRLNNKVNIYEERNGWYRIGTNRWVNKKYIKLI